MARINLDDAIRQVQQAASERADGIGSASAQFLGGLIDENAWDEAADRLGDQLGAAIDKAVEAGASLNFLRGLLGLERK